MKFKGKTAVWYWGILLIVNGMYFFPFDYLKGRETELLIYVLIADFVLLPPIVRNYLFLTKDTLTIYFGFGKDEIKVREILEVKETRNPIAAGATSMDRIVIRTRQKEMICAIRNKQAFYKELRKYNRRVSITERTKKKKEELERKGDKSWNSAK